jgi:hypothetical protein
LDGIFDRSLNLSYRRKPFSTIRLPKVSIRCVSCQCGDDPLDDAHLRLLERRGDADLLRDVDLYLLLGDPIAPVLQEVQRRLGVPGLRGGEQHRGHLALPVGRALLDRRCRQRVEFLQPAQLRRGHIGSIGKIVTFQAQLRRGVQITQARLGGAQRAIA